MSDAILTKGEYYSTLTSKRQDSNELKSCMERTVQKFLNNETNMHKPGILLGKIQGGKQEPLSESWH
jgi:hypothetical protein